MLKKYFCWTLFSILVISPNAPAKERDLRNEVSLHPMDGFSAQLYEKGHMSWQIPVLNMSVPFGWIYWGVTDWLTIELDLEANLGGAISTNLRFPVYRKSGSPLSVAFETMYQALPYELNVLEGYDFLIIERSRESLYSRFNFSYQVSPIFFTHFSIGGTYTEKIRMANNKRAVYREDIIRDEVNPDVSLGLDWRYSKTFAWRGSASYGSTFTYLDNVPKKEQYVVGFHWLPFPDSKHYYLQNMGLELGLLQLYFREVEEKGSVLTGFLYWAWD